MIATAFILIWCSASSRPSAQTVKITAAAAHQDVRAAQILDGHLDGGPHLVRLGEASR